MVLARLRQRHRSLQHDVPLDEISVAYLGDGRCMVTGVATSASRSDDESPAIRWDWSVGLADDGRTIRGELTRLRRRP